MHLTVLVFALAQTPTQIPAGPPPEAKQFDFWVGSWSAEGKARSGPDSWKDTKATNTIRRVMDGFAVQEQFKMGKFEGSSWSVYDAAHKLWKQTWVDNQGAYIDLAGAFEDGKMTLKTLGDKDHPGRFARMVFSNISAKSFDWNWESTADDGKNWKLQWHLHYMRK